MMGCTWLLLWIINSARQLDSKVQLQTAADAAGQSGVGILARGMNAIAFANQLEAELFAAIAVMQATEATPASASAQLALLPVFEEILSGNGVEPRDRPIPAFRREVIEVIPPPADELTRNIGRANGAWRGPDAATNPKVRRDLFLAVLWSTSGRPIGRADELDPRTRHSRSWTPAHWDGMPRFSPTRRRSWYRPAASDASWRTATCDLGPTISRRVTRTFPICLSADLVGS